MTQYTTFIGIDLGGARGKTTAVARLDTAEGGDADSPAPEIGAMVIEVNTRYMSEAGPVPWCDEAILEYLSSLGTPAVVAVAAPLTGTACGRCTVSACPGVAACEVPATVWLRTVGQQLQTDAIENDMTRIAAVSTSDSRPTRLSGGASAPLMPYVHRCTEIDLHYRRGLLPRERLGQRTGPVAARGAHLCRRLTAAGFALNNDLLEVSPRATVAGLFGHDRARGYKRDADPWQTRAEIVEALAPGLRFSSRSRLSREQVLRNDHCFEALVSAYTGYLGKKRGWTMPTDDAFADDGWIWAPDGEAP